MSNEEDQLIDVNFSMKYGKGIFSISDTLKFDKIYDLSGESSKKIHYKRKIMEENMFAKRLYFKVITTSLSEFSFNIHPSQNFLQLKPY